MRIRRGLYACAHLSSAELEALRCGGLLDCVSALRVVGAELPDDGCRHVRFHPENSRARPRPERASVPVLAHWSTMLTWRRSAAR
ncbi:MAG TPA: hypothetical protein VGC45_05760 [Gryllotalpicola sp.]